MSYTITLYSYSFNCKFFSIINFSFLYHITVFRIWFQMGDEYYRKRYGFVNNKTKFQSFYMQFSCCQKAMVLFILLNLLIILYLLKLTINNNIIKYKKEVFLRTLLLKNLWIFLHIKWFLSQFSTKYLHWISSKCMFIFGFSFVLYVFLVIFNW